MRRSETVGKYPQNQTQAGSLSEPALRNVERTSFGLSFDTLDPSTHAFKRD